MKTRLAGLMIACRMALFVQDGFAQQTAVQPAHVALTKRKSGDPLKDLPKNMEVLTSFGERADISPDNKSVAFMAGTFGHAMVMDVKTHAITCLTCNIPAAAFLRVMHLPGGDYLLIGPEHFENVIPPARKTMTSGT